ncbi:MAG: metal ABC transporter ATP-binding protein [Nitriliruptor sp.]|nr:MAG: metal ABC transporter ATP-binding protein [Nitriliruptor sp.]
MMTVTSASSCASVLTMSPRIEVVATMWTRSTSSGSSSTSSASSASSAAGSGSGSGSAAPPQAARTRPSTASRARERRRARLGVRERMGTPRVWIVDGRRRRVRSIHGDLGVLPWTHALPSLRRGPRKVMGTVPSTPPTRGGNVRSARDSGAELQVRIEGLSVAYGDIEAVRDVDLTIDAGTVVAVIGPNGSGKSTLVSTISGLVKPTRGRASVTGGAGQPMRNRIAHVLQTTVANEAVPLTVLETVRMGAYGRRGIARRLTAEDRTAIEDAIDRMRISDLRNRQLHELSGGQRQRTYVAQGLAQRADVLLLDEPITGLDLVTQETITQVIAEERDAGRIVFLTTHDVGTARLADVTVLMATEVVAAGPPSTTLTPELLGRAYGGHVHVLDDGTLILDDPNPHDHRHEDHLAN